MGSVGEWQALAQKCVDIQQNSIPKQWLVPSHLLPPKEQHNVIHTPETTGVLTTLELEITQQDARGLLGRYRSGTWSVRQVVTAFLKRATLGQQLLNFATEFLAEEALQTADILDQHFARTGKLYGPLHGVPVSVKEHIQLRGRISHASFVSKIGDVSADDALVVKLVKNAGAVIHIRTNQPQSIMHLDCDNNITGRTLNPCDLRMSPGGSSGGEGASIGFKASVIGIGTDIGGSVRVPAAFNNSYALRPSALRNPNLGLSGINPGQESIRGITGPHGQSLDDLELFQRVLLDQRPWDIDTALVPLPWRDVELPQALTIGILVDDGIVRPHPPVLRALETVRKRLASAGIRTVDWQPFGHEHGWSLVSALYFPDGGERYRKEFAKTGEPALPLTEWAFGFARPQPLTIEDNWQLNAAREAYRREHHALMKKRGVDVILGPAYVGAGALQGTPRYWNYTAIWNILDLPALVMPSGLRCDKELDVLDRMYEPRSEDDRREWEAYDPALFHGLPIAMQFVGRRWEDETLLKVAKLLEKAMDQPQSSVRANDIYARTNDA